MSTQSLITPSVSFASPILSKQLASATTNTHCPTFAFARIQGEVCLVQLIGQADADASGTPLLVIHIFRHEFVSIFRFSHSQHIHPLDIRVLEPLDDQAIRYEEDNGTVFLAKDLMAHLKRIIDGSALLKTGKTRRNLRG